MPAVTFFAPLSALHRPGASVQRVQRDLTRLSSPAGVFSVRSKGRTARPTHDLELDFESAAEVQVFWDWFTEHAGALVPFWLPSYQQDLVPIETIAVDDVEIDIQESGYATHYFPSPERRTIIFLRDDGTYLPRRITAAESNGDGTETITIDEALGETFTQSSANGICFLWFVRLVDDAAPLEWDTATTASLSLQAIEVLDPPDTISGCVDGAVEVNEAWDFADTATARLSYPSTVAFASGAPAGGDDGSFRIEATLSPGLADTAFLYHTGSFLLEPFGVYTIEGSVGFDEVIGSPDSAGVKVNGVVVADTDGTGDLVPFSADVTLDGTGVLTIAFGIFNRQSPGIGPFVFEMGPFTATRICV